MTNDWHQDERRAQIFADDGLPAEPPKVTRRRTGRRLAAVATGTTIALGAGGIAYAASTDPTPSPSESSPSTETPSPSEVPDGSLPEQDGSLPERDGSVPERDGDLPGMIGGHHGPAGALGFGFGMALHGEQVVETKDGVYETIATQRGVVEEVTDDSVTVTSEDGYTRTYTLTADSLSGFAPPWADDGATPEESAPDAPAPDASIPDASIPDAPAPDESAPDAAAPDTANPDAMTDLAVGDDVMLVATVESGTATVTRILNLAELPAMDEHHEFHGGPGLRERPDSETPEGGTTPEGDAADGDTESSST